MVVSRSESPGDDRPSGMQRFEQSQPFQFVVVTMIFLNTVQMAWEADTVGENPLFDLIDNVFLLFFMCELTFRLCVYGIGFFTNQDKSWNIFDLVIVVFGAVDQWIVGPLSEGQHNGMSKFMMVLRILRILRVMRAFRLFKQFKKLNTLAKGLVDSLQSVFWIAVLFVLVIFVYAIVLTNLVGRNVDAFDNPDHQELVKDKFGTILRSMETLFIFLTCDDWSTPARVVNATFPFMELVWVTYISLGVFTLLSLLTGSMADRMNQARTADEDSEAKEQAEQLKAFLEDLQVMFEKADRSRDKQVDLGEFKRLLCQKKNAKKMQEWGLPAIKEKEAEDIFEALDRDNSGHLSWDEFRDGLLQMRRPFAVKDIMWLEASLSKLDRSLAQYRETNAGYQWDCRLSKVHARANLISERLGFLEHELGDFFESVGYDPPSTD